MTEDLAYPAGLEKVLLSTKRYDKYQPVDFHLPVHRHGTKILYMQLIDSPQWTRPCMYDILRTVRPAFLSKHKKT